MVSATTSSPSFREMSFWLLVIQCIKLENSSDEPNFLSPILINFDYRRGMNRSLIMSLTELDHNIGRKSSASKYS